MRTRFVQWFSQKPPTRLKPENVIALVPATLRLAGARSLLVPRPVDADFGGKLGYDPIASARAWVR